MNKAAREEWQHRASADGCAFCLPREDENEHWLKLKKLSSTTLYLQKDQTYRGYCVLIWDGSHKVRISQLSSSEWSSLCEDIRAAQIAIEKAVKPDHFNVATLGNQVAHMHWHLIPRYVDDPRWSAPIWTTTMEEMAVHQLSEAELREMKDQILAELV